MCILHYFIESLQKVAIPFLGIREVLLEKLHSYKVLEPRIYPRLSTPVSNCPHLSTASPDLKQRLWHVRLLGACY